MITAIGIWVKNLIFLVLFAAFMELLLPAGSMKKFLRMVIGMFLLLAILKPVTAVLANDFSWVNVPIFSVEKLGEKPEFAGDEMKRKKLTYHMYQKELSEQMVKVLENIEEITAIKVEIQLDQGRDIQDGDIVKAVIVKAKMAGNGKKIQVDLRKNQAEEELNDAVKNKIRQRINSLYQISKDKISFG